MRFVGISRKKLILNKHCLTNMTKTFIIVSVSDRVAQLNALLYSIRSQRQFDGFEVCVLYQDYLHNHNKIDRHMIDHLYVFANRLGCNCARILLLRKLHSEGYDYDIYCNLDDDMTLMPKTNYDAPIKKLMNDPECGFILTNWARTEALYEKKVAVMEDKFVPQVFVYQGGGMLYRHDVANHMRKLPLKETVFDEGWALTAYLYGYKNYRYLGSVAVHAICTKGGMAQWYKDVDYSKLSLLYDNYINYRKTKDGVRYHIPMDSDLTEAARMQHQAFNQKRLHTK